MVTTIQLNEDIKAELDRFKSDKETYEQVILNLINVFHECQRNKRDLLIEGCKVMADENIKITKEFEAIEDLNKWEW
jgi:predicted CopG family antitoxin